MQQIMVSIIIRKTVEIKRHFKSVTNLAKFKRYTAQNGTRTHLAKLHKGNNKITELRVILQRESQNS
jgi:hypothetical protein